MSTLHALQTRNNNTCELCNSGDSITAYTVPPKAGISIGEQVALCERCNDLITTDIKNDPDHWRCLHDSIWSPVPAVQVLAFRILKHISDQSWAVDLANSIYMDDETAAWAMFNEQNDTIEIIHLDCNGEQLQTGDTVKLIKDLNVKGANFTAKRGTAVRRIRLVHDNAEQIEGKVEGQQIVILTRFVKKSS